MSDGGPLVAIAEMAMTSGRGARLETDIGDTPADWFAESQGCYVVSTGLLEKVKGKLLEAGIEFDVCGKVSPDNSIEIAGGRVGLDELRDAHESFFPDLMQGEL